MDKITITDVAAKAGVSKSTVSQYLNKRYEYMGLETRRKIKEAIDELGYQPNVLARGLKQKRTSTIGIIVANIVHHFSTEVCRAIEDYCHEHHMNAILCNTDEDGEKEKNYIETLRAKQVDGIILFPTGKNGPLYKKMADERYPIVFVDRRAEGVAADTVVVNNRAAVYQAVEHLVGQGHKRIAMITAPLTISTRTERVQGYKEALIDHGLGLKEEYLISCEMNQVQNRLEDLFAKQNTPSALIAANDLVLLEVLAFIKKKNLKVPEELALVVFDNFSFAQLFNPSLTTISQPSSDMGRAAAELLLQQIRSAERNAPRDYVFECKLVVRESSMIDK